MSQEIDKFIEEISNPRSTIAGFFGNRELLISSLKELKDVIGMKKIKTQIMKQIKSFVAAKAKGIYKDKDRKHCLLCGPPGCGKTTVAKILCKIWIGMGFIGVSNGQKKLNSFNKLQDEIIRKQKSHINEYKEKLKLCTKVVNNLGRVGDVSKRALSTAITFKDSIPKKNYVSLFDDLTGMVKVIEKSNEMVKDIHTLKSDNFNGYELEAPEKEMEVTREDTDLPFYVFNRNDVVSRYVGDTSHRCTKALNESLGGVAYFDEAYNLCNENGGFGDTYGREALTIINQYMDTFSDRLIVVFSGYKEDIYNNLFKIQRGLESRFTNKFEIEKYTPEELTYIYIQRLEKTDWTLKNSPELVKIIRDNFDLFEYQGRDMDTLAFHTKNIISETLYDDILRGNSLTKVITDLNYVRKAIQVFKSNMIDSTGIPEDPFSKIASVLRS